MNGIKCETQAQLVRCAFVRLHEAGIRGISLTMDGHTTNRSMLNELGGNTNVNNLNSTIPHPCDPHMSIYCFLIHVIC